MEFVSSDDVRAAFKSYMENKYNLSSGEAEICAMDLLKPSSWDFFLFEEYLCVEKVGEISMKKYLAYVDLSAFPTFPNSNPIFCFYILRVSGDERYCLGVSDDDVKSILGDEWSCKD